MTPIELAKQVFPDADEAFLDHAIWARTGAPCFFDLKEGQTVEDRMREQLIEFRRALAECPEGKHLCDHCNNFVAENVWHCWSCDWNRVFDASEV